MENGAHFSGEGHLIEGQIEGDINKTITPVAVDASGHLIVSATVTPPALQNVNLTQISGTALTEGQKTMAGSLPVVIASDQSALPVSGTVTVSNPGLTDTQLRATPVPVTVTSTTITGNVSVIGTKTNNNAAPTTQLGVMPALANAAPPSWTEGNQVLLSSNLSGALRVTQAPSTSGGVLTNVQQVLTTSALVKGSAGQKYGYLIYNPNSNAVWVFWYNQTTAPTAGSTTNLIAQMGIPSLSGANVSHSNGVAFSTGIYVAVSSSANSSVAPVIGLSITTLYV